MNFTLEDYRKIENWLQHRTIKDSQFEVTDKLHGDEEITILQKGVNRRVPLHIFDDKLVERASDFYNVTARHNKCCITLNEALRLVPLSVRREGTIISFIDKSGNWTIAQFIGVSINQWYELRLWNNPIEEICKDYLYLPDNEDTEVYTDDNNVKYLKLKDREYKPVEFSGKGYKILRKNIQEYQDSSKGLEQTSKINILTQDDFQESNTIYVVRYDFKMQGSITMPDNCELHFEGGTLICDRLDLQGCKLVGMVGSETDYIKGGTVENWHIGQIEYRNNVMQYYNGTKWITFTTEQN